MKNSTACIAAVLCTGLHLTLCGCVRLSREDAVPATLTQAAMTTDVTDARFWPELDQGRAAAIAALAASRERDELFRSGRLIAHLPAANYLAISSGGDDGADHLSTRLCE